MPTINVLSKNKKNITIFHLKIIVFTAEKMQYLYTGVFLKCAFTLFVICPIKRDFISF